MLRVFYCQKGVCGVNQTEKVCGENQTFYKGKVQHEMYRIRALYTEQKLKLMPFENFNSCKLVPIETFGRINR